MQKQILLIDDEEGLREIIQVTLEAMGGWKVITADSGLAGLSKAESEQPDAILLDMMMPDMDGVETLKRLRSNPCTQSIPIIFLTAKVQESDRRQFMAMGASGVIIKPFRALDLVNQIRSILGW
jgi:CheY-like chemotaxis protein